MHTENDLIREIHILDYLNNSQFIILQTAILSHVWYTIYDMVEVYVDYLEPPIIFK